MASCGTANGDGTNTDKEQQGLSCAETNDKNESACISAVRQQVEATDDFLPRRLLCGAGDAPTSGEDNEVLKEDTDTSGGQWIDTVQLCGAGDAPTSGEDDEVTKEDTDTSGGQWIDTVQKVVKKETKTASPWLDNVSSSDSSVVEAKKEGSEVASAMEARCTNFASMLLIEENEIEEMKKYSCW
jgi:hypothetical protein